MRKRGLQGEDDAEIVVHPQAPLLAAAVVAVAEALLPHLRHPHRLHPHHLIKLLQENGKMRRMYV